MGVDFRKRKVSRPPSVPWGATAARGAAAAAAAAGVPSAQQVVGRVVPTEA